MSEIESFPCNSKEEARERERYHFILMNACLNMKNPTRSEQQLKQYQNEYRTKKRLAIQNVVQNNLIHTSVTIE
jgi:hypothetical protein